MLNYVLWHRSFSLRITFLRNDVKLILPTPANIFMCHHAVNIVKLSVSTRQQYSECPE